MSPSQLHAPFYILLFTNLTESSLCCPYMFCMGNQPVAKVLPQQPSMAKHTLAGVGTGETSLVHADQTSS